MAKIFPLSSLATADLVIDAVYESRALGNTARTTYWASSLRGAEIRADSEQWEAGTRHGS
jgi:hypothetical protein